MLNFEIICSLKAGNVDRFLKSYSREFHTLMDDGIQAFCEILVRLRVIHIYFYCFSGG